MTSEQTTDTTNPTKRSKRMKTTYGTCDAKQFVGANSCTKMR